MTTAIKEQAPIDVILHAALAAGVSQRHMLRALSSVRNQGHQAFLDDQHVNPYTGISAVNAAAWTLGHRDAFHENS